MRSLVLLSFCLLASGAISAEELSCAQVLAMAKMARAKSAPAVAKMKAEAGDSYRANLVFAFRTFELRPRDRSAAAQTLALIPLNAEQDGVWHTFGDYLCPSETEQDLKALASLQDRLPRDLARAVLILPDKMSNYVTYAYTSIQDPDSDYAVQMQTVCRKRNPEFLKAVELMPVDNRAWFVSKIFDPARCRALKLPEAN